MNGDKNYNLRCSNNGRWVIWLFEILQILITFGENYGLT